MSFLDDIALVHSRRQLDRSADGQDDRLSRMQRLLEQRDPTAAALRSVLDKVRQQLHRQAGRFGGLLILSRTDVGEYPEPWQEAGLVIQDLEARRRGLEAEWATDRPLDAILPDARELLAEVWGDAERVLESKREDTLAAAQGAGLDAAARQALVGFIGDWSNLKITDAPNPFWKQRADYRSWQLTRWPGRARLSRALTDDDPWLSATSPEEVDAAEREAFESFEQWCDDDEIAVAYGIENRYLHVDGDVHVNAPKSAAGPVARERAALDIDEAGLFDEVRAQQETAIREEVLVEHGARLRRQVLGVAARLYAWSSEGAQQLLGVARTLQAQESTRQVGEGLETAAKRLAALTADADRADLLIAYLAGPYGQYLGEVEGAVDLLRDQLNEELRALAGAPLPAWAQPYLDAQIAGMVEAEIGNRVSRQKAALLEESQMQVPDYWAELGRLVMKKKDFGRCWSCAGAAITKLVMDERFDGYNLESVGAKEFDHHFVLVGREDGFGTSRTPGEEVLVLDIWQANQGGDAPGVLWRDFTYACLDPERTTPATLVHFSSLPAGEERRRLREDQRRRAAEERD